MPTLTIVSSQNDVMLGEKPTLLAAVDGASPGAVVSVDITAGGAHWPGTVHINSAGAGGCVSSDVVLPGKAGTVTLVALTGNANSDLDGPLAPAAITVRVHG